MYPRPAVRGANKERVVVLDRQIIDRVPAERRTRAGGKLLSLILFPGQARHLQRRPRPADDACPNAQAPRFHPALPRNEERMLRRAGQCLHTTRFSVRQRDGDHSGGKPLDGGGDGLCTFLPGHPAKPA